MGSDVSTWAATLLVVFELGFVAMLLLRGRRAEGALLVDARRLGSRRLRSSAPSRSA